MKAIEMGADSQDRIIHIYENPDGSKRIVRNASLEISQSYPITTDLDKLPTDYRTLLVYKKEN